MVKGLATHIADQMGIRLSGVSVVEGQRVGCLDMFLLHFAADGQLVSALVHKSEFDDLQSGSSCERLEVKIQTALSRLKMRLESLA
jgi:hypothetical protein